SGQTVIHGAHPTGPGYRWRWLDRPFVPPAWRSAAQVAAGFNAVAVGEKGGKGAEEKGRKGEGASAPAPRLPRSPAPDRYGAAALAGAVLRVSTAATGDRNNTLFRQTAGLAELVNGGALERAEVERAMTG